MFFLITTGILTLQPTAYPKTKAAGLARHQLAILFLAVPLITLGTLAVWYNRWRENGIHFRTWHAVSLRSESVHVLIRCCSATRN